MLSVPTMTAIIITKLSLVFVQFVLESTTVQRPVFTQLIIEDSTPLISKLLSDFFNLMTLVFQAGPPNLTKLTISEKNRRRGL